MNTTQLKEILENITKQGGNTKDVKLLTSKEDSNLQENEVFLEFKSANQSYPIKATYVINGDVVDVKGDVDLSRKNLTELPFQFGKVEGEFYVFLNQLTSFKNSPREITGNCYYAYNPLKSLQYAPKIMHQDFTFDDFAFENIEEVLDKELMEIKVGASVIKNYNVLPKEEFQRMIDDYNAKIKLD